MSRISFETSEDDSPLSDGARELQDAQRASDWSDTASADSSVESDSPYFPFETEQRLSLRLSDSDESGNWQLDKTKNQKRKGRTVPWGLSKALEPPLKRSKNPGRVASSRRGKEFHRKQSLTWLLQGRQALVSGAAVPTKQTLPAQSVLNPFGFVNVDPSPPLEEEEEEDRLFDREVSQTVKMVTGPDSPSRSIEAEQRPGDTLPIESQQLLASNSESESEPESYKKRRATGSKRHKQESLSAATGKFTFGRLLANKPVPELIFKHPLARAYVRRGRYANQSEEEIPLQTQTVSQADPGPKEQPQADKPSGDDKLSLDAYAVIAHLSSELHINLFYADKDQSKDNTAWFLVEKFSKALQKVSRAGHESDKALLSLLVDANHVALQTMQTTNRVSFRILTDTLEEFVEVMVKMCGGPFH
jgi:hypothetical protein